MQRLFGGADTHRIHNSSTSRIPSVIAAIVRGCKRPQYSARKVLSSVTICETFATESAARPIGRLVRGVGVNGVEALCQSSAIMLCDEFCDGVGEERTTGNTEFLREGLRGFEKRIREGDSGLHGSGYNRGYTRGGHEPLHSGYRPRRGHPACSLPRLSVGADSRPRPPSKGRDMTTDKRISEATEPSALDEARSGKAVPDPRHLPPVEGDPRDEPGSAGSPHQGQTGHAGSGQDAELQSVGQSQSDRAAGSSS